MLVEAVKAYASHERQLMERVAAERSAAMRGGTPAQRIAPEIALGQQLGQLIALGEAYPELKASGHFSQLSDAQGRSDERRVGKEWARKWRTRWGPVNVKK